MSLPALCNWCFHMVYQDKNGFWIDDDTGDDYCPEGFMNLHNPNA